jgi:hypothetical protein
MQPVCLSQEHSFSTYSLEYLFYSGLADKLSESLTAIPHTTIRAVVASLRASANAYGGSTLAEV